ncbi:hypothetical protein [Streptomyces sp. NPDC007100]
MYPHLAASAVVAAMNTAMAHHLHRSADALARITAGLPTPVHGRGTRP